MDLKWWIKFEYLGDDGRPAFSLEIKRPKRAEARDFQGKMAPIQKAIAEASVNPGNTLIEQFDASAKLLEAIDETVLAQIFEKSVRNVAGLFIDGQAITTGPELLEVADNDVVFFVLANIRRLIALAEDEKKASASPSTSSVVAGQAGESSSAATPTASASGTGHSTATESPAPTPSGAPAP